MNNFGILEAHEGDDVSPRSYRPKSFIKRLLVHDFIRVVPTRKNTYRLRERLSLSGIGQMLAAFEQSSEVWYPTFQVRLDPTLRESPGLKYPLLLARRQQSFPYQSSQAYA